MHYDKKVEFIFFLINVNKITERQLFFVTLPVMLVPIIRHPSLKRKLWEDKNKAEGQDFVIGILGLRAFL